MITVLSVLVVAFALSYALLTLFRRPLRKSEAFTTVSCKKCGTVPHRVHRGAIVKLISKVIPLRSFQCRSCKTRFVRVKPLSEKVGAHA